MKFLLEKVEKIVGKAFSDDRINVTKNMKFPFERVEKNVRKGEIAGY